MSATEVDTTALLHDPVATELLQSDIPARLAYVALDGKPRVVPIWVELDDGEIVMQSPSTAPKLKSLARNPDVAITIDSPKFPWHVLLIRGTARLEAVGGVAPEVPRLARRYMGEEAAEGFCDFYAGLISRMPEPKAVRIRVMPEWVGINDFQTRFPPMLAPYLGA
jgi:PPOX class probable F420-dependent enzyme